MRAKSMMLILIALGCGLVASIAISQVLERGTKTDSAVLETAQIYVAATDIDVNEQLNAANVRVEDWPKSKVPEGAVVELDQIVDHFARVRFYEGEPILQARLAGEIEGAAVKIPEGFRVCSLKVQMDTAVSGLVKPGDRVDIFGYFRKSNDVPRTGTRQILRNVRVFAVNSETEQETDTEGRTIVAKTVSMLVENKQVAKLMLAAELGTLRLALRRPNEIAETTDGEVATVENLFGTRADDADKEQTDRQSDAQTAGSPAPRPSGFTKFLSSLQQDTTAMAQMLASAPAAPRAAWEMMVLTPDGGTHFSWDHEDNLPQSAGRSNSLVPADPAVPSTATAGLTKLRRGSDDKPAADDRDPFGPTQEDQSQPQPQENNRTGNGD